MVSSAFDKQIGMKIKIRRSAVGMTQTDLGKKLGLTFQQVQKYEKGANKVGSGKLFEIAEILGTPIDYFFDGLEKTKILGKRISNLKDSGKMEYSVEEKLPDKEVVLLLKFFSRIKDKGMRSSVISLAKSLSNSYKEE